MTELSLRPLRPDYNDLPEAKFEDGGCAFASPRDLVDGSLILRGDVVSASERGEYPGLNGFATVVAVWMVEFEVSEVLFDENATFSGLDRARMVTSEERIEDGYRYVAMDFVAEVEEGDTDVLAVAYVDPGPARSFPRMPQLGQAITNNGGTTLVSGNCSYVGPVVDRVAEILGDDSGFAMLERLIARRARGESLVELDRATDMYYQEQDEASSLPSWEEQDPRSRSLWPSGLPDAVRPLVDVVAVWMAIEDPSGPLFVRTESGISEPGLSGGLLPGAMPLYFLEGDQWVEVVTEEVGSEDPVSYRLLASFSLADVVGRGGIEVTGSIERNDLVLTVLSLHETAERLSVDSAGLEQLRELYLSF